MHYYYFFINIIFIIIQNHPDNNINSQRTLMEQDLEAMRRALLMHSTEVARCSSVDRGAPL